MPNDVINTITIGNTTYNIGGSGHTIEKSDGTDMTQRANLQFVDATVTDDSVNDRTKIENVKTITNESELDDLPDGIYIGPTDEGLPFDAGDIPYDNTESGLSSDNIQGAIDELANNIESSKPVYSTVETVVGTYLNKPLYSKTYQVEFSSSNSYYFDVPSAMDIKFVFGGVYSTRFDFIPFGYGGSGGDMVQCYRFSDTQFRIQNAYYASRMYCDVTLQYTKSTD